METPALLLLFAASFVNAIVPGPVVVLTFGRAARSGLRAGTTVSLGVLLADLLLVALALGVALGAFALSASGFAAMKWLGIAVLFALALYCLRTADRPAAAAPPMRRRDGVAGLMVGLTSPYNLVFYLALLPQVMPGPPEAGAALAIAATTLAGIALAQAAVVAFALGCRGIRDSAGAGSTMRRRRRWSWSPAPPRCCRRTAPASRPSRRWSVDADRRELVLARHHEGLGAVGDERQQLAGRRVDGEEVVERGLGPDLLGEIGGPDAADVDDGPVAVREAREIGHGCLLQGFLPLIAMVRTTASGSARLEVDVQEPVLEHRARDLHAIGQHEAALELARGDAAVQVDPAFGVVGLASAHHELVVLQGDREVVLGEAGQRQRDAVRRIAALLDVVGGIAVVARLGRALHQAVQLLEAEQVRVRREGDLCHVLKALVSSDSRGVPKAATHDAEVGAASVENKVWRRRGGLGARVRDEYNAGQFQDVRRCRRPPTMPREEVLRVKLELLQREHRDLDDAIAALDAEGRADALTLRRLKKRKLMLKDQIQRINDEITPDIIA